MCDSFVTPAQRRYEFRTDKRLRLLNDLPTEKCELRLNLLFSATTALLLLSIGLLVNKAFDYDVLLPSDWQK